MILRSRLKLWLIHCTKGDKALGFEIGPENIDSLSLLLSLRREQTFQHEFETEKQSWQVQESRDTSRSLQVQSF